MTAAVTMNLICSGLRGNFSAFWFIRAGCSQSVAASTQLIASGNLVPRLPPPTGNKCTHFWWEEGTWGRGYASAVLEVKSVLIIWVPILIL